MRRGIYIFVAISFLTGLIGMMGCAGGGGATEGNPSGAGSFSTVVQMNGKELTVAAPTVSAGSAGSWAIVSIIENSGHQPITLAELELVEYSDGHEAGVPVYGGSSIVVRELPPGQVRTLYWSIADNILFSCTIAVKVKKLE